MYAVALTSAGDWHMTRQKRWISINFLGGFRGAVLLESMCNGSKKQAKKRALDMEEAAAKINFFEKATGV